MTKSPEDLEADRRAIQAPAEDTSATEIDLAVGQDIIGKSPWEIFWRQFRRDRWALAGAVMVVIMILLAIMAPLFAKITGHGPNEVNLKALDQFGLQGAPFWWPCPPAQEVTFTGGTAESLGQSGCTAVPGYFLGVEGPGRDQFIRILYGARTSLFIAFFATGLAVVLGVILGIMAGFFRGKVDTVISRATDLVLSLPILLLALGLAAACGTTAEGCLGGLIKPGLILVGLIIGLFSWPYISRIIRGQVLSMREKEFVEASRSLGATNFRIMAREILPNVAAPLIVYTTLDHPGQYPVRGGAVVPRRGGAGRGRVVGRDAVRVRLARSRTRRGS